jgi:predicted AAA+ superfamily ATPase
LLPFVHAGGPDAPDILEAYVSTYLKEEIREEGLVRSLPPFLRFLNVAGQLNGQPVQGQNIAREAALQRSTVDAYFSILIDTLMGHFLPAWRPGLKVRETARAKFYWFDPGVARAAAGLEREPADRLWQGTAMETLVFHELRVYNEISRKKRPLAYYRTASGVEIDFVIETRRRRAGAPAHLVGIEVKRGEKWNRRWESGLRNLASQPGVKMDRMIAVYGGPRAYHFKGLDVLPAAEFISHLHEGKIY